MTTTDGMKVCLTKKDTWWLTLATALIAWLVSSYAIEPASVTFRLPFRMDSRRICDTSLLTPPLPKRISAAYTPKQRSHEIGKTFGKFPLSFEVNHGQLDPHSEVRLPRSRIHALFNGE